MDSHQVRDFLHNKNWFDEGLDYRFLHSNHPYVIIPSGEEIQVSLREKAGEDQGYNGEEIFTFHSLGEFQEWFENNIGE